MDPTPESRSAQAAARREARLATPRLQRELTTIGAMLRIYCRDHHGTQVRGDDALCEGCHALHEYARKRLAGCPFGPEKPTCVRCPVHCYGAQQREATRVMMRHAGPRMLWQHPLLALAHWADGWRPVPPRPNTAAPAPPDRPADVEGGRPGD